MSGCQHIKESEIILPHKNSEFYREECTLCFSNSCEEYGIDVCLGCLNSSCLEHTELHRNKFFHNIYLNIKKSVIYVGNKNEHADNMEDKLAIITDQETIYQYDYNLICRECQVIINTDNEKINNCIDFIKNFSGNSISISEAWQETIISCDHLDKLPIGRLIEDVKDKSNNMWCVHLETCSSCEMTDNLWLCFDCGSINCGRANFDGSGGNGHALEHVNNTQHTVCCKLGTITPEGTADVYCYTCDDMREDKNLEVHLECFGINLKTQKKTDKTMTELQITLNKEYDFSMSTSDGIQLTTLNGKGLTGIKNIGNTCYLASILQVLYTWKPFITNYFEDNSDHLNTCNKLPIYCIFCQLIKMGNGLLSVKYSFADEDDKKPHVNPSMLKRLVGKDHAEFSTMRQQDAYEFLLFLDDKLETFEKQEGFGLKFSDYISFDLEEKLQCQQCLKVKYSNVKSTSLNLPIPQIEDGESVNINECFDLLFSPCIIEGYFCPNCKVNSIAIKTVKMNTFPNVLVIQMRIFTFKDWTPIKLNVSINVPGQKLIGLEKFKTVERPPDEILLPDDDEINFDQDKIDQIMAMGFGKNRAQHALISTNNADMEAIMEWIFTNAENADFDLAPNNTSAQVSLENIDMITAMGFTRDQAIVALKNNSGNVETSIEWIFNNPDAMEAQSTHEDEGEQQTPGFPDPAQYNLTAFVSHKGPSTHCGHYIAHVFKDDKWVMFNDSKVAHDSSPNFGQGYVYFFEKKRINGLI